MPRSATNAAAPHADGRDRKGFGVWRTLAGGRGMAHGFGLLGLVLWAQADKPSLERVEAVQYVRLLGSLILLTLGGVSLVVLAWLALRMGRRHSRRQDAKLEKLRGGIKADDWVVPPSRRPNDMNTR
ncbi:MAG: hypothetical protein R6U98_26435 [Pirellulaceae bacterium]